MGIHRRERSGRLHIEIPDYSRCSSLARARAHPARALTAERAARDRELEDFKELTQVLPMGFGDDWLRFNGIGENVTGPLQHDNPSDAQKERSTKCCAGRIARHDRDFSTGTNDRPVHHLLEVLARVNAETPSQSCAGPLRISTTHRRKLSSA